MEFKDIAAKVADFAPLLGAALGGPPGAALGSAVKVLAGLLGIKTADPTPEEINKAINADPEMALKLKQADYQFILEMRRLDKDEMMAELSDLASARARQVEHEKAVGRTDVNLYALAWLIVIGFFALTSLMYFHPIPPQSVGPINQLFGALVAGFAGVIGYFFGSSRGSAQKTEAMEKMINKAGG